jgi:transcriptional regulator with XRE-family HTH domain
MTPGLKRRVDGLMKEMNLVEELVALRKMRGLSQRELAAHVGVKQPVIARIESGQAPNLELRTLAKIAFALGARVKIGFEDMPAPPPKRGRKRAA